MLRKVLRRLAWAAFTLWAVVTLTFVIHHALPSDPARALAGAQAHAADVANRRTQLGLDRPLNVQYGIFAKRLCHLGASGDSEGAAHEGCAAVGPLHFDLGVSYRSGRPVLRTLGERLPATLLLALAATF